MDSISLTSATSILTLFTLFAVTSALVASSKEQSAIYRNFQRVGRRFLEFRPVHEVVADGYREIIKPKSRPIVVRWWAKDYVILPPKYLADLKTAGWRHLSFFQNISDALFLHTTVGDLYHSDRMVEVVKRGINPVLPQLMPIINDEVKYGFEKELRNANDWTEVNAMKFFGIVAHIVATRFMICEDLCHNDTFIQLSFDFVQSIFVNALVIVKLPLGPFRSMLAYPISLLHRWKLHRCAKILLPIVKKRMAERSAGSKTSTPPLDAIEWTLAFSQSSSPNNTPEKVTEELLHNLWAGSSAPGGMMTEMVYQLLLEPKYLEPLRKEVLEAVEAYGWSEKMLDSLHLQDSYIREINRVYPIGSVTCSRTVTEKPFQFSDGLTLPVGTRFGFPIKALQTDPSNFEDSLAFKGFRFAEQVAAGENDDALAGRRFGAASMGTTNLAFGYGNHVCPGRYFAVREAKLVFSRLLIEYDIKWPQPRDTRPEPVHIEGQFIPNVTQKICLKRRQ